MMTIIFFMYCLLSFMAMFFLMYGINRKKEDIVSLGLWSTVGALLLLYNRSHGEILGVFFNYTNSILYTINLLILILSLSFILLHNETIQNKRVYKYLGYGATSFLIALGSLLLVNVWINAIFIENKHPNFPILQIANLGDNPYCSYRYVFYKTDTEGVTKLLCPNHYGLVPSVKTVEQLPSFITHQFKNH